MNEHPEELLDDSQEASNTQETEERASQTENNARQALEASDRILSSLSQSSQIEPAVAASRLDALEAQVTLLSTALARQSKALEALYTQLQKLAGDPVGRERVNRTPQSSFAPPAELSEEMPVHTSTRRSAPALSADPVTAAGQRQMMRNRAQLGKGN